MTFIEPAFLCAALGIAIPIAIHFWHQKRGKPLPWAATRWLTERDQQQSRGLQFDNRWLLLVRCLLLILLAILLAQPLIKWLDGQHEIQRVHLVQPNAVVAQNFRFELDEAHQKGEKIYRADETGKLVEDTDFKPSRFLKPDRFSPLTLQTAINQLSQQNSELHLYVVNNSSLASVPAFTVPGRFRLHTVVDSTSQPRPYLLVRNDQKLYVNQAGLLTNSTTPDASVALKTKPVHSGAIRVVLNYESGQERQTVRAALNALADVYALEFVIDDTPGPNQSYEWVLTDHPPAEPNPQTLYVVSGIGQSALDNVVYTNETLTPQTSERVAQGQLPEWLGEQLIQHYDLNENNVPLSQRTLNGLFVPTTKTDQTKQAGVQDALLLLFVVLLILERGIALTKNA